MNITRVNHLGVIVPDIEEATAAFGDLLGLRPAKSEVYENEFEIAFLPCGDTQLELIEPHDETKPAGRYLRKRGPGIQHVAFEVDDLEGALAELREQGVEAIGEAPRSGADDTIIAFLDPVAFGGILIELCQYRDRGDAD